MKSPGSWAVEDLFYGRPEALKLFNYVRQYIESLGPVKIEATKTQISFRIKKKFAWVWLPQIWIKKRSENSITLTFAVGRHIKHEQIVEAVETSPGRWTHHVYIENEYDLTDDVHKWLIEAYTFGQIRKSVKPKK